jgi:hypothetical protein
MLHRDWNIAQPVKTAAAEEWQVSVIDKGNQAVSTDISSNIPIRHGFPEPYSDPARNLEMVIYIYLLPLEMMASSVFVELVGQISFIFSSFVFSD